MDSIKPYIEEVKEKLNLRTYPEVMAYLGMHKQQWTAIQQGSGVNEKNAIRIAQILHIDPMEIMAISMALRAKNREAKAMWLKLAKSYINQRLKEEKQKKSA